MQGGIAVLSATRRDIRNPAIFREWRDTATPPYNAPLNGASNYKQESP